MWTSTLIGAAGMFAVAAITPGPNNLAVMAAAARAGLRGALAAIAGIVLGSAGMLVLVALGVGAAFIGDYRFVLLIAAAGAVYLSFLGIRLIAQSFMTPAPARGDARVLPTGTLALLAFQFVNPKAWTMSLTVISAARGDPRSSEHVVALLGVLVAIVVICTSLWSMLGAALSRRLDHPRIKPWFDRTMGSLLIVSALLLFMDTQSAYGTGVSA